MNDREYQINQLTSRVEELREALQSNTDHEEVQDIIEQKSRHEDSKVHNKSSNSRIPPM